MKVALVAPSSVPFVLGGAERLWNGLTAAINELTPHDAELIKLPSREHNLIDLVETYRAFSQLDLSHFDLVVTTKYPAWMVSHPHHVVYLQHVLRGLYDHYRFTGLPAVATYAEPSLQAFQVFLRSKPDRDDLEELFGRFDELVQELGPRHPALAFPGPLAREIVHHLDGVGLSTEHVARHLAISRTVAGRAGYFPAGASVQAVYHPSDLTGHRCGEFRYLFTASRLDPAKRFDLVIGAMQFLPPAARLRIAGTGPDEQRLRALAQGDPRIEFLGYVPSADLVDLYADALAVPFVPLEEDLGLITLEAMNSGKPIVTCDDSGGPTELVVDGVNGFVTPPTASDVGRALRRLVEDESLARRFGAAGHSRAESVTWRRTVSAILGGGRRRTRDVPTRRGHPKIVVTSTFVVHPPMGGGQLRCFHLARGLLSDFDVQLVSLAAFGERARSGVILPGMAETAIPKSPEHEAAEGRITDRVGVPLTDILATGLVARTPAYMAALDEALIDARAVILAHPFLYPAVRRLRPDLPIIYDAHNAEFELKAKVVPATPLGLQLREIVRQVEG